eukprot:4202030-Amphidinium_carterae.1
MSIRREIVEEVGLFFVKKKTADAIRMVVDARRANARHRNCPSTLLGSIEALSGVDLRECSPHDGCGEI